MKSARQCLAALACLVAAPAAAQGVAHGGPVNSPPMQQIIPLETTVNGVKGGTWPFVDRLGVLHAPREALEEWRVRLQDGAQPITVRGTEYWPLSGIPGFSTKVHSASQSVDISFASNAFAATDLTQRVSSRPPLSPVLPSAFFNYDLSLAAHRPREGAATRDLGVLTELGLSNDWGVLTSSFVGRGLAGRQTPAGPGWRRLETTFTRDLPQYNHTLRVGDAATRPGMWGRSLYFGGLQYGTNYALTPGFLAQPLPVLSGTSSSPSTVELYVNDVLRQVSSVPPGPFAIDDAALQFGGGEARLVVRDILGRETVLVQPFFTSAQLLAPGLNDWSAEAGKLRRDLGLANADYGLPFASGTWRRGISERLTLEARTELARENQVLGLGAVAALPGLLLGRAALVQSRDRSSGAGRQWLAGLERQWLRSGVQIQAQGANAGFRQLGESVNTPIKLQLAANVSHTSERMGTFDAGLVSIQRFSGPRLATLTARYAIRLAGRSSLNLHMSRIVGGGRGSSFGASLTIPLEKSRQVGLSAATHGGVSNFYATATQSPDAGSDLGWRLLAGAVRQEPHAEGGLYYAGRYGRLFGDLSASRGQSGIRAGATGGMVLADGHLFATRRVDQSFALVEIPGYEAIGVGLGSNRLTQTDAHGVALIPQLSPYQANSVRVDPKELPISAEIGSIEQTVVPAWRSAVKARFAVRGGTGALIKFNLDDGSAAPAGAIVRIEGDEQKQEFYVARRGEAFLTGLRRSNRLVLSWKAQTCTLPLDVPVTSADEIARLGPLQCEGVKR